MPDTEYMSRFSKKIAILISPLNPLWGNKKKLSIEIPELGVTFGALRKWVNGEVKDPEEEKLEAICNNLAKSDSSVDIKLGDFSDEVDVYHFAKKFSIDRILCNKIIDLEIYRHTPLLRCFYYQKRSQKLADNLCEAYKGLYKIYRLGTSDTNSDDVFVMRMHVRYVLDIHSRFLIRCKLHVPDPDRSRNEPEKQWIQYDGFVTLLGGGYMYWVFESRDLSRGDLIFMITDEGRDATFEKHNRGVYISINRESHPQPVCRTVLYERVVGGDDVDETKSVKFMHDKPDIYQRGDRVDESILHVIRATCSPAVSV